MLPRPEHSACWPPRPLGRAVTETEGAEARMAQTEGEWEPRRLWPLSRSRPWREDSGQGGELDIEGGSGGMAWPHSPEFEDGHMGGRSGNRPAPHPVPPHLGPHAPHLPARGRWRLTVLSRVLLQTPLLTKEASMS